MKSVWEQAQKSQKAGYFRLTLMVPNTPMLFPENGQAGLTWSGRCMVDDLCPNVYSHIV
jgi:hypothetical protein